MSLFSLKQRSLARQQSGARDSRIILIACDDTFAVEQYFNFFRFSRVHVQVISTPTDSNDSHISYVLGRMRDAEQEGDIRWLVLDIDHCLDDGHKQRFLQELNEARRAGIHIALSQPCFELWLLLHHHTPEQVLPLKTAKKVEKALRQALGQYDKTNLQEKDFTMPGVRHAIAAAQQMQRAPGEGYAYQENCSDVWRIWCDIARYIASDTEPELRALCNALPS